MECDQRWLCERLRASQGRGHLAWKACLFGQLETCVATPTVPLASLAPSGLAAKAESRGLNHASDGTQRALENPREVSGGSEMWAENEIQLERNPACSSPGSLGRPGKLLPRAGFEKPTQGLLCGHSGPKPAYMPVACHPTSLAPVRWEAPQKR
jgi:hypothetical protein